MRYRRSCRTINVYFRPSSFLLVQSLICDAALVSFTIYSFTDGHSRQHSLSLTPFYCFRDFNVDILSVSLSLLVQLALSLRPKAVTITASFLNVTNSNKSILWRVALALAELSFIVLRSVLHTTRNKIEGRARCGSPDHGRRRRGSRWEIPLQWEKAGVGFQ